MSFGFGIGDFITVLQLANNIRKTFIGAPEQFSNISEEVRNLSNVLQDVELILEELEPDPRKDEELESIAISCRQVLTDLENLLAKYHDLEPGPKGFRKRTRRVWQRLNFEPDEVAELRNRIISNVSLLNAISGRLTRDNVVKLLRHQEHRVQDTILDWLTPIDHVPQHNTFRSQRLVGSGQRFLESPEYKQWIETDNQTLFCPGIPGAGKTVLTSIVVDDLTDRYADDSNTGIAYVYCGSQQIEDPKAEDFLASLLKQLAGSRSSLPKSIKSLYEKHKDKRTRPSLDDVSTTLYLTAAEYSTVIIVVDALDECPEAGGCRVKFMSEIYALQRKHKVKIYITSRPIMIDTTQLRQSIKKQILADEQDVRLYLEAHMGQLPLFIQRNQVLQERIKTVILEAVGGMFLLARIYLDSLKDKLTVSAVKTALQGLVKQGQQSSAGKGHEDQQVLLQSAYNGVMERIDNQRPGLRLLANQVLKWVTYTRRPLTTAELQLALAVQDDPSEVDEENFSQIEDMVSVCAGLVAVDDDRGIIRLVHYTAYEYLMKQKNRFPDAETDIMETCVSYLSLIEGGFCNTDEEFEERLQSHPFYDYAARNWGHHARAASSWNKSEKQILDILKNDNKLPGLVQAMMVFRRYPGFSQHVPRMSGIHVAAYFGLLHLVVELCDDGAEVDARDTYGRSPLSWAAQRGNETVVKWLLENGADVNSKADAEFIKGCTPLWFAAQNGHDAVVRVLVASKGIELDSAAGDGQTPLARATRNGHEAVVKILTEHGASVTTVESNGRTPLSPATQHVHKATAKPPHDHAIYEHYQQQQAQSRRPTASELVRLRQQQQQEQQ